MAKRLVAAALVAAIGLGWPAPPTRAEGDLIRISGVRLGLAPDDSPDQRTFPEGTRSIYIRFTYAGATSERLVLKIAGPAGIELFSETSRYSGDGSATVEVTGADVYRSLVRQLDAAAKAGQSNAQDAARQAVGAQEFLMATQFQVSRMRHALDLVAQVSLGQAQSDQVAAADTATAELVDLVDRALALPPDDVAGKQALAAKMAAPFRAAVLNAGGLVATAGQVRDVVIPGTTIDAPDAPTRNAYVLNFEVGGDIVVPSTEFWVGRTAPRVIIYLPAARQQFADRG